MLGRLLATVVALLVVPAAADAFAPPTGYGGANPFRCTLQQAGYEATAPDGDTAADPYCVRFEKDRQNLLPDLGIVDFTLQEPARVAAALGKCFYFQSDHWRSSVVQDNGATEIWEWEGRYWFDLARGDGGAYVRGFEVLGRTSDPTAFPGMPAEWARYMGPGTGGFQSRNDFPVHPGCAARAKADPSSIYWSARDDRGPVEPTGGVDEDSLGPIDLGDSEAAVRLELGDPAELRRGYLRYAVAGGGELLAGLEADRSGPLGDATEEPVVSLLTTSAAWSLGGVSVGDSAAAAAAAFPGAASLADDGEGGQAFATASGVATVFVVRDGLVVAIGTREPGADVPAAELLLQRPQL